MNNLVIEKDGKIVVSSRDIAEKFEKRHSHVCDAIENLTAENSEVKKMFIQDTFNHRGNIYKHYWMDRDGFSLLVMGFTGQKALEWKLKYIEAFNKMEDYIKNKVPQLTKKQELQLKVINGNEGERLIALGEYTDYIEDQARKPLEEKLNFIIKNATTVDEFQRIMCCFVNAIAKKTNTNSQTVYANLYDFLKKKEGIDLYARCRNAKNKAQQERIAQGKKPYSEATLQNKFSIKSTIKESEYEKILFIIKAKSIEEGLTIEELNKSIKFYVEEIA